MFGLIRKYLKCKILLQLKDRQIKYKYEMENDLGSKGKAEESEWDGKGNERLFIDNKQIKIKFHYNQYLEHYSRYKEVRDIISILEKM